MRAHAVATFAPELSGLPDERRARLEDAIDACETTANILEGIVIKNA